MYTMNFTLIFLLLTLLCICVESIFNGNFVSIRESPYYVALINDDDTSYCGGAIISEYWVLTAAHCFNEGPPSGIRSGKSSESIGLTYDIEKIIVHGDCDDTPFLIKDADIALIKLKTPISFNEYQQPIKLTSEPPKAGDTVILTGLGYQGNARDFPNALKKAEVFVIEQSDCKLLTASEVYLTSNVFCAGNSKSNVCPGDSGGPAVIDDKLVGVPIWSFECIDVTKQAGLPGGYTRVHKFYDWIVNHTKIKY